MRRLIAAAMVALLAWSAAPARSDASELDDYDRLLSRYVSTSADGVNRVRYAAWKATPADQAALDRVVAAMERRAPSRMGRDERFAYWVNLYNAVTLQIVLENHPVRSIRDIPSRTLDPRGLAGPWRTPRVSVEGRRLSLDQIEHAILRPEFRDPRVHYAVNCASIGCPNLKTGAWRAETLDADLDAAARAFVNHPRGLSVEAGGKVSASSLYRWFSADFGGEAGVIAHLRRYASPPLAARLAGTRRISTYAYDWSLNERR